MSSKTEAPLEWHPLEPEGAIVQVGCGGGTTPHPKRVLGRFQNYTRGGKNWGYAEVYPDGTTPPCDQYLIQDSAGEWIEVDEATAFQQVVTRSRWRARWVRQCPKCDRHYVFDLDKLVAKVTDTHNSGEAWLDLSR